MFTNTSSHFDNYVRFHEMAFITKDGFLSASLFASNDCKSCGERGPSADYRITMPAESYEDFVGALRRLADRVEQVVSEQNKKNSEAILKAFEADDDVEEKP